jgi:hypothetical protein
VSHDGNPDEPYSVHDRLGEYSYRKMAGGLCCWPERPEYGNLWRHWLIPGTCRAPLFSIMKSMVCGVSLTHLFAYLPIDSLVHPDSTVRYVTLSFAPSFAAFFQAIKWIAEDAFVMCAARPRCPIRRDTVTISIKWVCSLLPTVRPSTLCLPTLASTTSLHGRAGGDKLPSLLTRLTRQPEAMLFPWAL